MISLTRQKHLKTRIGLFSSLEYISYRAAVILCYLQSLISLPLATTGGFPGGTVVKNLPANAGDADLIPVLGRSPGEGNGNLLQYSCLVNPMNRGAWQATVHGVSKELDPARQLNDNNEGLKYRMFPNLKELEIVFSNQKSCNLRESPQNLNEI